VTQPLGASPKIAGPVLANGLAFPAKAKKEVEVLVLLAAKLEVRLAVVRATE
jgi:hypothetical protein